MKQRRLALLSKALLSAPSVTAGVVDHETAPIFNEMMSIDSQAYRSWLFDRYYNTAALHQKNAQVNDMSMAKCGKSFDAIEDIVKDCMEKRLQMGRKNALVWMS